VFNAAGSLYYVPYPNSIDIIDVQHAMVRMRFSLGETVPTLSTAMPISIDASFVLKSITVGQNDTRGPRNVGGYR